MSIAAGKPIASDPEEPERMLQAAYYLVNRRRCSFEEAIERAPEVASLLDDFADWRTTTGSIPVVDLEAAPRSGGQEEGDDEMCGGASSISPSPDLNGRVGADPFEDPVDTVPDEAVDVEDDRTVQLRRPPLPSIRGASTPALSEQDDEEDELPFGLPGPPQYRPEGGPGISVESKMDIEQFATPPGELDRAQQLEIEGDILRQWLMFALFLGLCTFTAFMLHILFRNTPEWEAFNGPWMVVAEFGFSVLTLSLAVGTLLSRQVTQEVRHRKQERLRAIRVAKAQDVGSGSLSDS